MSQSGRERPDCGHLLSLVQFFLNLQSVGDIDECHDTTYQFAIALDRVRLILGREVRSICAKHDLVVDVNALVLAERLVDGVPLNWVLFAIRACVMHEIVHMLAEEISVRLETEEFQARWICEGAVAFHIGAIDALARGVQQQPDEICTVWSI